jgi:hypothetical protein
VQQQDQRAVGGTRLRDMEPGPVGSDVTVLPGARDLDWVGVVPVVVVLSHA